VKRTKDTMSVCVYYLLAASWLIVVVDSAVLGSILGSLRVDDCDTWNKSPEMVQRYLSGIRSALGGKDCSPKEVKVAHDCSDIQHYESGAQSGVYTIVIGPDDKAIQVYCDMTTNGGGWTVFQLRQDGSVDFYRNWADYASGFGDVAGEQWLGNDNLAVLTGSKRYVLRVDLTDNNKQSVYAEYDNFTVSGSSDKYTLTSLGSYTGDAGDSLAYHKGMKFSTNDQDNDADSRSWCAKDWHGGWWYKDCYSANLNGEYNSADVAKSLIWATDWDGWNNPRKFTAMKIRPF